MYPHAVCERSAATAARVDSVGPNVRVQGSDAKVPEECVGRADAEIAQELATSIVRKRVDPLQDTEISTKVDSRGQGDEGVVEISSLARLVQLVVRIGDSASRRGGHSGLRVDQISVEGPLVDERGLDGGEIGRRRLRQSTLTGAGRARARRCSGRCAGARGRARGRRCARARR